MLASLRALGALLAFFHVFGLLGTLFGLLCVLETILGIQTVLFEHLFGNRLHCHAREQRRPRVRRIRRRTLQNVGRAGMQVGEAHVPDLPQHTSEGGTRHGDGEQALDLLQGCVAGLQHGLR